MWLKKAPHHTGRSVKKKNMHRLALVAIISLLFFTSLCVFSLLGQQPLALAVGAHSSNLHGSSSSSSTSPSTPSMDCVNLANVEDAQCFGGNGLNGGTPIGKPVGVADADYNYLDGDPTCKWSDDASSIQNFYKKYSGSSQSFGVPQVPPNEPVNEDTCHGNSACYSDNSSGQDGQTIADHIGGDDVSCYNSKCFQTPDKWPDNVCGKGVPYERFACADTGVSMDVPDAFQGKSGNTEVYYNPSAYNPPAIIEIEWGNDHSTPNTVDGLKVKLDNHHGPTCSGGVWYCPGDDPVIIDLSSSEDKTLQPMFWVMCGSKGAKGKAARGCTANTDLLKEDWLSGDRGNAPDSGNLVFTPLSETVDSDNVRKLFGSMEAIAYALIVPVCVLIGYQLFLASWNGRMISLQDTIPRVLFSVVAIGLSYELVTMLIALFDVIDVAIVNMHVALPYPRGVLLGNTFSYGGGVRGRASDPATDIDLASYRDIVIPTNRWGCVVEDFVHLLSAKLAGDIVSFVPVFGGITQFAIGIADAIYLFEHLPEFAEFLFSVNLCAQLFVRIIMINYYILMAPVAFGCWGLPAGIGERVVGQWAKGFFSLLFVQTVQLFVLTTLPLIAPEFPNLPSPYPLLNVVLQQVPSVVVLAVVIQIPKMMGGGMGRVMAQAGTVASGAVAAVGAAAYQIV
jgi:hypothetical protein